MAREHSEAQTVHWQMLRAGCHESDRREVVSRLVHIAPVPIVHLVGRWPVGNPGAANVSAFKPMPTAPELERLVKDRDRGQYGWLAFDLQRSAGSDGKCAVARLLFRRRCRLGHPALVPHHVVHHHLS
jgi:hypothetical protein